MADPLIARVVPGLVLQGDPGAQRNRDQVWLGVRAVTFSGVLDEPYKVPGVSNANSPATFPARLQFPLRSPDLGEGVGHWFVDGQEAELSADFELVTPPGAASCTLRCGLVWESDPGTTTVNQAIGASGGAGAGSNLTWTVAAAATAGRRYRGRWLCAAMGPQEQWTEVVGSYSYEPSSGVGDSEGSTTPRLWRTTVDFSGTVERSLTLYTAVVCGDPADVSVVDIRLKRVTAYVTGFRGLNE